MHLLLMNAVNASLNSMSEIGILTVFWTTHCKITIQQLRCVAQEEWGEMGRGSLFLDNGYTITTVTVKTYLSSIFVPYLSQRTWFLSIPGYNTKW